LSARRRPWRAQARTQLWNASPGKRWPQALRRLQSASAGERWPPARGRRWSASACPGARRPPERALWRTRTFCTHRAFADELTLSASGCPPTTSSREEEAGWGCGGGSKRWMERDWIEHGGSSEENDGVRWIYLSRVSSNERGK
jgi:hypothetical protein